MQKVEILNFAGYSLPNPIYADLVMEMAENYHLTLSDSKIDSGVALDLGQNLEGRYLALVLSIAVRKVVELPKPSEETLAIIALSDKIDMLVKINNKPGLWRILKGKLARLVNINKQRPQA